MKFFCTSFLLFSFLIVFAQENDTTKANQLETVVIKAFERTRKLKELAAAENYINYQDLEKFGSNSIVQAINATPGIRMEERSPGSYRLNIRGSSLRSPFGVRNVKIYYNDLPFTDPGGNSYLNALGNYNFNSLEIIKGPGSSVYGAGTGGVMLIESMNPNEARNVFAETTAGSFGLRNFYASATVGADEAKNKFGFQHMQSEGYRFHSALERNIFSWNGRFATRKAVLKTTFLYSRLFYETPGALTKAEYDAEPRVARPVAGGFPGAEQSKASINENTFLAGAGFSQKFSERFSNTTSAYGMFTELNNPAIRNYGRNLEPHVGGRTVFRVQKSLHQFNFHFVTGTEWQQNFSSISVYKNRSGERDTLQTTDDIPIRQSLLFLQVSFEKNDWELSVGGSVNYLQVKIKHGYPFPSPEQQRDFSAQFEPRVSLAKKWKTLTVYSSIAKGFSPPASTELLPSGSSLNLSLNAEEGTNYDVGFKGGFKEFSFDVDAFLFRLQNAIVQRRDASGGDFYTNAGSTLQKGVETSLNYSFLKSISFLQQGSFWLSHTWHLFRYKEFKQLSADYSGNRLPGEAPYTISTGIDIRTKSRWLATVSYFFSDKIPLNDTNSDYANAYHLLQARVGFEKLFAAQWQVRIVAGGENLLNAKYSLGNDINAAGGRYYNAAATRNFYLSFTVQRLFAKEGE